MIVSYKNYFKESNNIDSKYLSVDLIHDINDLLLDLKDVQFNYLMQYWKSYNHTTNGEWINSSEFKGDINCIKSITIHFNCFKHYDDLENRKVELATILKDTIQRIYKISDEYDNTYYSLFYYPNSQKEIGYNLIKSTGISNLLSKLLGNNLSIEKSNSSLTNKIAICVFKTDTFS